MSGLILPPSVAAQAESESHDKFVDAVLKNAEHWTRELRYIDPYLSLARIGDNADPRTGFLPGCWYIRKRIPEGSDEWMPLIGGEGEPDEGEYREPGPWILDLLNENDMWNPRAHRNRAEAKQKLRDAKTRARALEREQRHDEGLLGLRAVKRLRSEKGLTQRTDLKR